MILAALWYQVDYACRRCTPWYSLARGPVSAKKSLLLDYVSDMSIIALRKALQNKHSSVVLTIVSGLLIHLMTVVSTGLLSADLATVWLQSPTVTLTKSFDGSSFINLPFVQYSLSDPMWAPAMGAESPAVVASVILGNLTYPAWTTSTHAIQPFELVGSAPTSGSISVPIDTFSGSLSCEAGQAILNGSTGSLMIDVTTATCFATLVTVPVSGNFGGVQNITCSDADDLRLWLYMGTGFKNGTVSAFSNIICKPSYHLQSANVTLDLTSRNTTWGLNPSVAESSSGSTIPTIAMPGISSVNITVGLFYTLWLSEGSLYKLNINPANATPSALIDHGAEYSTYSASFVRLLLAQDQDMNHDMDTEYLTMQAQGLFSSLIAQFASYYLQAPSTTTTVGTVELQQNRLFLGVLSMRILEGILVIVILAALTLVFLLPRSTHYTRRDTPLQSGANRVRPLPGGIP